MPHTLHAMQRQVVEWSIESTRIYEQPFREIELDAIIIDESGESMRIPAYWAGGTEWRFRFSPPHAGVFQVATECSDGTNESLHGVKSEIHVSAASETLNSDHPGAPVLRDGKLEYEDGTPFFWLGDTWWMALSEHGTR